MKWGFILINLFLPTIVLAQPKIALQDAIYMAIRENPYVQQAQLKQWMSQNNLKAAEWQFKPHYSFHASRVTNRYYSVDQAGYVSENTTGVEPAVSLKTGYGTNISLTSTNNQADHYHPGLSLSIMQPLIRGFGKPIVEAALNNARDDAIISRLNVEKTLRDTVTIVIHAYLDVIAAEKTLDVDKKAFTRALASVKKTELLIKAGHKPGVELIAVQADSANAQMRIENDKNQLAQTQYALLTAIGLDPNTVFEFTSMDLTQLIKKFHTPSLTDTKKKVLAHDIQYQTDQLMLKGTLQRNLLLAEDNTRWELNLTVDSAAGNGTGGGQNAGINSLINGVNQTNRIALDLSIPIDDQAAKMTLANAKISLREAEIALRQEKWAKETNAINVWHSISSSERALTFAENAEHLQQQSYHISFQKYSHGLIDSLELQSAQQLWVSSSQNLILARINYLKALVNLDQMVGGTLNTWHIQMKLP